MLEFLFGALLKPDAGGDVALLRRVANGDGAALRVLYDRCAGQLLAVALRILRDQREAEEAVQETFVDAWKRAGEFDLGRGSAAGWLIAICRSRALDRLRARGAVERMQGRVSAEPTVTTVAPVELAEQRQQRDRVQAALAQLTPAQRSAIELAYFEGLTQREIAERAGEPLGTIKSRMRMALQKLLSLLSDPEEGTAP